MFGGPCFLIHGNMCCGVLKDELMLRVGADRVTKLRFVFELADIAHLSSILAGIKKVDSVFDAYRVVPR